MGEEEKARGGMYVEEADIEKEDVEKDEKAEHEVEEEIRRI